MRLVSVMLDYIYPWPNAAGFFVAFDQGWYREAGLDVDLRVHGYARGDVLAHLVRGEVDFGVFPSNRLLVRREHHEPVVGVAAINHTGLETIQVVRRSGIERPRDLAAHRVAFGPTPRGVAMVSHLVAQDGGEPDDVVIVDSAGHELTPEYLLQSGVDAMFGGYWCWDLLSRSVPSDELLTWRVSEIGAPKYHSYLLGTQESHLERDPELVRDFLAATSRGFVQAAADQEATVALLARALPYLPSWKLQASLELVATTWFHEGEWGYQQVDALVAPYAAWLHEWGVLQDPGVWQGATTNEFLDHDGRRPAETRAPSATS